MYVFEWQAWMPWYFGKCINSYVYDLHLRPTCINFVF